MSEMVERVAAAIARMNRLDECDYAAQARAAIEAMREPTNEAMERAADKVYIRVKNWNDVKIDSGRIAQDVWQAMIDAALGTTDLMGKAERGAVEIGEWEV